MNAYEKILSKVIERTMIDEYEEDGKKVVVYKTIIDNGTKKGKVCTTINETPILSDEDKKYIEGKTADCFIKIMKIQ